VNSGLFTLRYLRLEFLQQCNHLLVPRRCPAESQITDEELESKETNTFRRSFRAVGYTHDIACSTQPEHLGWPPLHLTFRDLQLRHARPARG
jgi:hypothetical protein